MPIFLFIAPGLLPKIWQEMFLGMMTLPIDFMKIDWKVVFPEKEEEER